LGMGDNSQLPTPKHSKTVGPGFLGSWELEVGN